MDSKKIKSLSVKELKCIIKMYKKHKPISDMKKPDLQAHLMELFRNGELKKEHADSELVGSGFMDLFRSPKTQLNNGSKAILEEYGQSPITKIQIIRTPIMKILDKVLQVVSLGQWSSIKKYYFDDLFHLGLIATIQSSKGLKAVILEKNEVINISTNVKIESKSELMDVPLTQQLTLRQLYDNGEKSVDKNRWFLYSGLENNCQDFIMMLLNGSNLNSPPVEAFVKQPLEELTKKLNKKAPHVPKIMNAVTNFGARINQMLGRGKDEPVHAKHIKQAIKMKDKKQKVTGLKRGELEELFEQLDKIAKNENVDIIVHEVVEEPKSCSCKCTCMNNVIGGSNDFTNDFELKNYLE